MTIAGELADFVTRTSYADLPPQTIDHAAMLIASTIASSAMGSGLTSAQIIHSLARERGGTPEATIWFDAGPKLPIADAARVNAVRSAAAASSDSDLRNIVHPGTGLAAASLAMAEKTGSNGQDVLSGIVLGYEVVGRIGEALLPNLLLRGWHGCIVSIFGGTVAMGRLLKLTAAQMTKAIALSATSIGGLIVAANTSTAREYHDGNAAIMAVNAVLAAQKGYTTEESIFETSKGFVEMYGGKDPEIITRDFGKEWDIITDMGIKLVPGGHPSHALGEAAANAARAGNVSPDEIETITIWRPRGFYGGPQHPTDLVSVAHSPLYFVAAGAADKSFSWVHASPEKISDPVIHALIDKIRFGEPPNEGIDRFKMGAVVTIKTKDGRSYTSTVYAPKGAGVRGVDWADIDSKYKTLVPLANLSAKKIDASLKVIHDFRSVKRVSELIDLLNSEVKDG